MGSSLLAEVRRRSWADGWAESWAEGAAIQARAVCLEFVKQYHPALSAELVSVVEACTDAFSLLQWALAAPLLPHADFARLIRSETATSPRSAGEPSSEGRVPRSSRVQPRSRRSRRASGR